MTRGCSSNGISADAYVSRYLNGNDAHFLPFPNRVNGPRFCLGLLSTPLFPFFRFSANVGYQASDPYPRCFPSTHPSTRRAPYIHEARIPQSQSA